MVGTVWGMHGQGRWGRHREFEGVLSVVRSASTVALLFYSLEESERVKQES
jgi:hypothetical protein